MRKTLTEHIQRIKYLNGYMLKEGVKYSLVDDIDEDDNPEFLQNDSTLDNKPDENKEEDSNSFDTFSADNLDAGKDVNTAEPEIPTDNVTPNLNVNKEEGSNPDEIQNEIIRTNIEVMKQLNQKLGDLELITQKLRDENLKMSKDVEEVREPTNVEKLVQRKEDSHPFYYGLNDMWKDNWFQARRDQFEEKGIKKLDDGTYIADFDDLPKLSSYEIKNSYNNY